MYVRVYQNFLIIFFWCVCVCVPQYFSMCIEALKANSDKFKVFCLVHKMDLVPADVRANVFAKQVRKRKEKSLNGWEEESPLSRSQNGLGPCWCSR